jgi:hypothetical protein
MLQRRQAVLRVLRPMIVNDASRQAFAYRRFARAALDDGFQPIAENGEPLWRFIRGSWGKRRIVATRVAPNGHEVWIKVEGEPEDAYRA